MKTETLKGQFSIRQEVNDINKELHYIETLLKDYKMMQAGDWSKAELEDEKEKLIRERNKLLSQFN